MIKYTINFFTDKQSWINASLKEFIETRLKLKTADVRWYHSHGAVDTADIAFYLSYGKIVPPEVLRKHKNNIVVHESDLPKGRGWSPLTWQVLEGKNKIPITLFEASESVDSGPVYLKEMMSFQGNELVDQIRAVQAKYTLKLCLEFLSKYPAILKKAKSQEGEPTFYRRRIPRDSELDISLSIQDQFDLLRVVDNVNYPAYFQYRGCEYKLKIEKIFKDKSQ